MNTLQKLPTDHTEAEKAIIITPDLKEAIVQQDPAFEELMAARRAMFRKVDKWGPVDSPDDSPRMEEAKRLRMDLVKNRTALDRLRKAVGDRAHKVWKATNDTFSPLIKENSEAEDFLKESEEFAKNYEMSRQAELAAERTAKLILFLEDPLEAKSLNLGVITEETFGHILSGAQQAHNGRVEKALEEERKRQEDRLAREAAEKALAEERKAHAIEIQQQRDKQAVQVALVRRAAAEAAALAAEEQRALETAAKLEREAAQAEALRVEAIAAAERKRLADIAATEKAKADAMATEKRQQEAAAAKKAADEEEARKKAEMAPDKEKLSQFVEDVNYRFQNKLFDLKGEPLVIWDNMWQEWMELYRNIVARIEAL